MNIIKKTLFSVCTVFACVGVANADSEQWRKDLAIFPVQKHSVKVNIAKGLRKSLREVDAYFPVLTPLRKKEEQQSLRSLYRLQGKDKTSTMLLLKENDAFLINLLHESFTSTIDILDYLIGATPNDPSLIVWLHLSSNLMIIESSINVFINKLSSRNIVNLPEEEKKQLFRKYNRIAYLIIRNIAMPMVIALKETKK